MKNEMEKSHAEIVAELDERLAKMAENMKLEGYEFELLFPNESEVVLKAGGKTLNFNKKEVYGIKSASGNISPKKMEDYVASEIIKYAAKDKS